MVRRLRWEEPLGDGAVVEVARDSGHVVDAIGEGQRAGVRWTLLERVRPCSEVEREQDLN